MADQTERIIIEIDGSSVKGDAQHVERAIQAIGDAADNTGKKVDVAEKGISDLGGALKTTGSSAKTTERDFQSLQSTIGNAKPAQAQADALKQVANSAQQSAREMANLGRTTGGGVGQIHGITSAATPAASAMSSLSGAAGLLGRALPMVGAAAAAIKLSGLISESTQLAARYETLGVVMNVVGKNAGYTSTEMQRFDKSLQKTGISMAESRNNLAKMASANIDLANATQLARIAQDAAVIGNMNSSQAFESLIYGIQSAQVEVLRTIGINVNFEQSYKKLAGQLGKTSNELTEAEKTQARLNAVMEKAPSIAGAYEASMDTVGKKLGSTERLAENAKTMLGALFLPSWTAAVDAYSGALVYVNEELERIDVGKAQLLGRALADVFKQGNPAAATPSGFMFEAWLNYQNQAEAANVAVKKSFVDTWGEIERVGINSANTFIASEDQRKATIQKSNDEILESFRKLNQTQIDKLDEQREAFLKAGASRAEVDSWYAGARAKVEESVTKKHSTELKKQVSDAKKARAEMLKDGKAAEDAIAEYWTKYEDARIKVISDSAAETVKIRTEAEKEAADKAKEILEKQQEESQKVIDNITESTADVFYDMFQNVDDGWATLWEGMKNYALKALAQIAAQAATTQIVVPVLMAATGAGSGVDAVTSITGGNGLSGLSNLAGLGNSSLLQNLPGYGYVSGLLATQLPGTVALSGGAMALAGGGTAGGSIASLAAAENLAGLTGGLSIGSALGMGSLGGLGYSLLGGALGLPQNQYSGITSSLGGALGAWGGTALAGTAGAALGATAGSVVPIVGTAVGAILGGLAGSLFGGDEQSPSVIFQKQQTGWGQTTGLQYHTKDGGSNETGDQLSAVLGQYMGTVFDSVEASLGTVGDEYVAMLDDAVIEWGRKAGSSWKEWDFGSDMDIEELMAKAQADLKAEIYEAASGAFTEAGQAIANDTDTTSALAMLSGKAAESMQTLLDAIRAGVQSGDVEAYAAQITALQAAIGAVNSAWEGISAAANELVKPLTAYESAVKQANAQFDTWEATLKQLGFSSEKIAEIEDKRAATLARLNAEMGPLAEAEAARASALAAATNAVTTAQGNLRAAYQREAAEIEATAKKWDTFADSLKKWRDDIMTGSMSPVPASSQADLAASRYQDVLNRAKLGDEEAIAELQGVAGQQLDVAKDIAATAEDYARSAMRTLNEVQSVETVAQRQADIARQQLDALTSQVEKLITINESVLSVADAIAELNSAKAAQSAAQAAGSTSGGFSADAYLRNKTASLNSGIAVPNWYTPSGAGGKWSVFDTMSAIAMAGMTLEEHYFKYGIKEGIKGYASGGMHSGGLRLVGENGPELEVTGPARIWNAEDTRAMLSGGGDGTASEVRALRDDLRAIGRALAKNTADTAKLMQRWDGDGMPEVRVA